MWKLLRFLKSTTEVVTTVGAVLAAAIVARRAARVDAVEPGAGSPEGQRLRPR